MNFGYPGKPPSRVKVLIRALEQTSMAKNAQTVKVGRNIISAGGRNVQVRTELCSGNSPLAVR